MSFADAVAALKQKHSKADVNPTVLHGPCASRAAKIDFQRGKGDVYAGMDADGVEVLVYFNENGNCICCTEVEPDNDDE